MELCSICHKNKIHEKKMCVACCLQKEGLPWMNQMKIITADTGPISYIEVNGKEYLVVLGSCSLLFPRNEVENAHERFRGERDLLK